MGFDANSAGQPLVNVHKPTTKVNLWMAAGVAVFFAVGALVVGWMHSHHGHDHSNPPEQREQP